MKVALSLDWAGDMTFVHSPGNPAINLQSSNPAIASPPQALAYALAACMAMDIVHIIQKARQELRALVVRFDGERADEHPRRFTSMNLHFEITGTVESKTVDRAIELSRTTYCSVWNSIRTDVELTTSFNIQN